MVISVGDFLERYDVDALRYDVAVAGPETQDTDFTWSEFVRRNNDELVATWGNLVNRAVSFAARNIGSIPEAARRAGLTDPTRAAGPVAEAFGTVESTCPPRGSSSRSTRRCGRWPRRTSTSPSRAVEAASPTRTGSTVLHVALQLVDDAKTLLTPFLPRSSQQVHELLGGTGTWSDMPRVEEVDEADGPSYPVITGTYDGAARWASVPLRAGTPLAAPRPLFTKLDTSVVDEELARLGA